MMFALLAAVAVCQSLAIRPENQYRRDPQPVESLVETGTQPLKSLVALDVAAAITEGPNAGARFITVPSTFTFLEVNLMVMTVLAFVCFTFLKVMAPQGAASLSNVAALWQFGYDVAEVLFLVTLWANTDNVRVVSDTLTGGFFAWIGVAAVALVLEAAKVARGEVADDTPRWLVVALPASVVVTCTVGVSGVASAQMFGLGIYYVGRVSLAVYWVGLALGLWGHSDEHEWRRATPVRFAALSCALFLVQVGLTFGAVAQSSQFRLALGWAMLPGVTWAAYYMNRIASEASKA